jgi:hypothetical protein
MPCSQKLIMQCVRDAPARQLADNHDLAQGKGPAAVLVGEARIRLFGQERLKLAASAKDADA